MLCYRYIILMVPPTYYMLISQLNSTSTFFFVLQFYVILSPVLLYVVLIYIYKLYVYCSVPSYNHQKQKPSMSLCSMKFEPEKQNRKNHDTESQIRIENPEKTKNQSTQSTKQSAGFLHNITL